MTQRYVGVGLLKAVDAPDSRSLGLLFLLSFLSVLLVVFGLFGGLILSCVYGFGQADP